MDTQEWALVIFTILMQMAVGSFLVLGIVYFFASRKHGAEEANRLSDRALWAIGPVLALGMLASLFHLGTPLKAYTAVSNFGSSWISSEILFTVIFLVLGGIFAIMQWRKIGTQMIRNVIGFLAALAGLYSIYAMSRIYMVTAQPSWNTWATPVFFFATTFLLGVLAIAVAYVFNYNSVQKKMAEGSEVQLDILRNVLRWIALAAVVILGVQLVVYPLYLAQLAGSGPEAAKTASLISNEFVVAFIFRLVLAFVGAGLLAVFLYNTASSSKQEKILATIAYFAFLLVLAAEILGRYIFYASHVRVGV